MSNKELLDKINEITGLIKRIESECKRNCRIGIIGLKPVSINRTDGVTKYHVDLYSMGDCASLLLGNGIGMPVEIDGFTVTLDASKLDRDMYTLEIFDIANRVYHQFIDVAPGEDGS